MQELVYVSEAKLRQFKLDVKPSRFSRLRKLAVKPPLVGEYEVELADSGKPGRPTLLEVKTHLEDSRKILWFADPTAQSGNWIHFETKLDYAFPREPNASDDEAGSFVVFWNPPTSANEQGAILILHGSGKHMIEGGALQRDSREFEVRSPYSQARALQDWSRFYSEEFFDPGNEPLEQRRFLEGVTNLLRYCYQSVAEGSAAWMSGYARVTATDRSRSRGLWPYQDVPIVVASPLYVSRTDAPTDE
jgi:hypothetical protein